MTVQAVSSRSDGSDCGGDGTVRTVIRVQIVLTRDGKDIYGFDVVFNFL